MKNTIPALPLFSTYSDIEKSLKSSLLEFAYYRARYVDKGLESPAYAAQAVERYALGLMAAIKLIVPDHELIKLEYDSVCENIDPDYKKNLGNRNKLFADLSFRDR